MANELGDPSQHAVEAAHLEGGNSRDSGTTGFDTLLTLLTHWRLLAFGSLVAGSVALGVSFVIPPSFTARTVFLPPQQQQSLATSALASLGALAGLTGTAAGLRNPADQYVALMQTTTVADRIIDKFDLLKVYEKEYRVDARKELARNVRISAGRKDGLITVEVDDNSPSRAADVANSFVDELRRLAGLLVITEAQQRRAFFEAQLDQTRKRLFQAQESLQASGFNPGAIKAEPKAAAESYAKLRAELTAAEVRVQTLRQSLTEASPEVQRQTATVIALREQLGRLESSSGNGEDTGYVGRYREFKYQEALFELFSRQFEIARLDESREGTLIQVVDSATPPEKKSKPKRAVIAVGTTAAALVGLAVWLAVREWWRKSIEPLFRAIKLARPRRDSEGD